MILCFFIMLPGFGFGGSLMMSLLGNFYILMGGISVSILAKYWIAVIWYLASLWGLTTVFTLILVKSM